MTTSDAMDPVAERPRGRLREALSLSIPIIVSQLLMTLGGFVSNLLLSWVDPATFAAGLLTSTLQLALVTVVFGVLFSLSALVGRILGEQTRLERAGQLLLGGVAAVLMLSLPVMALLYYSDPVLGWLGQPAAVAHLVGRYFRWYLWAVPAAGLVTVCIQFLLGSLRQHIVLLYSLVNFILSTLLAYVLIFGKLSMPALGIEGLAIAYLVTSWGACLVLGLYILTRSHYRAMLRDPFGVSLAGPLRQLFKLGLPIAVQMGNEIGAFLVTTVMVGWLGVTALNIQQVATRYLLLLVIPIVGLSQAVMIIVSRCLGARNPREVRQQGRFYMSLGLAYSAVVLVLFALFPRPLIEVFMTYTPAAADTFRTLALLLIVVAIGQIFDSVRNIATGALRGLHDARFPMQVSVILIWPIGVPLSYWMGFTAHGGLVGIAAAHDVVMALACGILWLRWRAKSGAALNAAT